MRAKRKSALLALLLAAAMTTGCVTMAEPELPEEPVETDEAEPITSLRAQDDFYGYVNLEKLDSLEIGFGKSSAGAFDETQELIDKQIESLIKEIADSDEDFPAGSPEQLIRALYRQSMQYTERGEECEKLFGDVFARIDAVDSVSEYAELMAEFQRDYGVTLLMQPAVMMNYFEPTKYCTAVSGVSSACGIVDFKSMTKELSAAMQLKQTVQNFLSALGVDSESADARSDNVVYLMLDIANATDFEVLESSFPLEYCTELSLGEMEELFSNISFADYVKGCGAKEAPDSWYITDRKQLETINSVLTEDRLEALCDYARAAFTMQYGSFLPDRYSGIRSRYFGLSGEDNSKDALDNVNSLLTEEVSEVYAKRCADEETISAAKEMCEDIRASYRDMISGADWLGETTRTLLCKKLDNMLFIVGYSEPKSPDPADEKLIGSNLLETMINLARKANADSMANIGKDYDSNVLQMPAQTVNACYTTDNTMNIPYGIMNPPFFSADNSKAQNLGALGTVIAHEISHAFDSDLIAFNAEGAYDPNWLPEADRLAFEERMKRTEEYYSCYTIMDVYHVDGKKTLGENFADLGGVQCVMSAVSSPDEKRELLESYAALWCCLYEDTAALSALRYDVHSPDSVRVNAVVASLDDFYELYDVGEEDGMYVPPEKRVSRW